MKPEDFDLFAVMVKQRSGLILTREKSYLLESRLVSVARKWNMKSLEDMAQAIRSRRDEAMMADITESMTITESMFFRDRKPFQIFRQTLLPKLVEARSSKRQLRIWSAGAASGQEAYSLAMICAEEAELLAGWKIDIIATDLSREAVERGKNGIYSQLEAQRGLPIRMLVKYFQQAPGDKWQVKDSVRQMVQFREGNLLKDFGPIGMCDVIFCRNVFNNFEIPTKKRIAEAMGGVLALDGTLVLGRDENLVGITEKLKSTIEPYLYILSSSTR
jgi:chemotaxis protein methyltransferase CheR